MTIHNERPPHRAGGTVQTAVDPVDAIDLLLREPSEGTNPHLYAFYGTLMSRDGYEGGVSLTSGVSAGASRGECRIPGLMYSVNGMYPALVTGEGVVHGELWEVRPEWAMQAQVRLDQIEGYRADREAGSLYLRRRVRLLEPDVEAWVYIWNDHPQRLAPIPSGRWSRDEWRYTGMSA